MKKNKIPSVKERTGKRGKPRTKAKVKKVKKYKNAYAIEPFDEWRWTKYDTSEQVDLDAFIERHKNHLFFIGTDSQGYSKSRSTVFTSVLIAYERGKGGNIIRHTDRTAFVPVSALSAKLTVETQRSIEICKYLEGKLFDLSDDENDYTQNLVGVSIDVNVDPIHKSGRYKDMLVGMVVAYGYNAFIKPDAWAAATVADARC